MTGANRQGTKNMNVAIFNKRKKEFEVFVIPGVGSEKGCAIAYPTGKSLLQFQLEQKKGKKK